MAISLSLKHSEKDFSIILNNSLSIIVVSILSFPSGITFFNEESSSSDKIGQSKERQLP